MCRIPEKKFDRDRVKFNFLIFQPENMLNIGLNFPHLSLFVLINVMLIKKSVLRKN